MISHFLLVLFLISSCTSRSVLVDKPCKEDPPRLEARSKELSQIVQADQADRQNFQNFTQKELQAMGSRDKKRLKRVGEIFAEGCFSKAQDFAAAALVYQHGNAPEHFYQTYLWAKQAVELGDPAQERMMALGIDRYLVNIGNKQLYASQATKEGNTLEACWCLQDVEKSFPDYLRKKQSGKNLKEALDWINELNVGKSCPNPHCAKELKPTPQGTVPGLW